MMAFAQQVHSSKSCIETITPDRARELLERNQKNRNISLSTVREYERAMREKRWRLNGETIKIGPSGELLDGQHRLHACIRAGVPFITHIVYDVEVESFDTIDIGRKRTAGDVLAIDGCKNSIVVGAAMRMVDAIRANITDGSIRLSADEARRRWLSDPQFEVSAGRVHNKVLAPGVGCALHYLFSEKDGAAADKFFEDLANGSGLAADDPVFVLRERLVAGKMAKTNLKKIEIVALCVRAWNHRRAGRGTMVLKGTMTNKAGKVLFPEID